MFGFGKPKVKLLKDYRLRYQIAIKGLRTILRTDMHDAIVRADSIKQARESLAEEIRKQWPISIIVENGTEEPDVLKY